MAEKMEGTIPIISLWQPWAIWVAKGWKTIETRTHNRFKSLVGQRIGIHVALKWDSGAIEAARSFLTVDQIAATSRFLRIGGGVICTAYVADSRRLGASDASAALIECTSVTRYGLFLRDIESIEAVPMRGRQGVWYATIPGRKPGFDTGTCSDRKELAKLVLR